jgi:hypothetical protein
MRRVGLLCLEFLFVALLYTAVGVVVGILSAGRGRPEDLLRLLLLNLVALAPLVLFVWKVDGTWWSVWLTCMLSLAILQIVVPRLELQLELQRSLIDLPRRAINASGAGLAAGAALILVLRGWSDWNRYPPPMWPAGRFKEYAWRVPAWLGAFSLIHLVLARIGRWVLGQTSGVSVLQETAMRSVIGLTGLVAILSIAAHLRSRTRSRFLLMLLLGSVVSLTGRWLLVYGWPVSYQAARLLFRAAADVAAAALAAFLFLRPPPHRTPGRRGSVPKDEIRDVEEDADSEVGAETPADGLATAEEG